MSCCRCRNGICVDCKCAFLSRFCTNCSSSQCKNKQQNQQAALQNQKAVLVNVLQLSTTESISADSCEQTSSGNQEGTEPALLRKSTGVQSSPDVDTFAPSHWEYYRGSLEAGIVRMYRSPLPHVAPSSNHRMLTMLRSFMMRTWRMAHRRVDIISVRPVENPLLYRRYVARQQEIALAARARKEPLVELKNMPNENDIDTTVNGLDVLDKNLHKELNECFLLHGTTSSSVDSIARLGFDMRLARGTTLYGRGIYLAENCEKAFMYTDFMQKRSILGKQCVIVVRTTLGRIFLNKKMRQFCRPPCAMPGCRDLDQCTQHGDLFDSVVTSDHRRVLPREFIVFDGSQCYPELVVTFQVLPSSFS